MRANAPTRSRSLRSLPDRAGVPGGRSGQRVLGQGHVVGAWRTQQGADRVTFISYFSLKEDKSMVKKAKKTGQRTLAVVLSILMLMTSWVFVAPQKAAAATYSAELDFRR